jgi:hypothetical protein
MGVLVPGPGRMSGYLWPIVWSHVTVALVWGNDTVSVPVSWQEGFRDVFLMVITHIHLFVPDTNLLWGPHS